MMRHIDTPYNGIKVTCHACEGELKQVWHNSITENPMDSTVTYECDCGETKETSERFWEYKDSARERAEDEKIAKLVSEMSNFVNRNGNNKKFALRMGREHKTLQQSFTGLCMEWMKQLSLLGEYDYDGRNEASVKLAKEIFAKVDSTYLPLV